MEDSTSATTKKDSVTAEIKARFEENEKVRSSMREFQVWVMVLSVCLINRLLNWSLPKSFPQDGNTLFCAGAQALPRYRVRRSSQVAYSRWPLKKRLVEHYHLSKR
jgi:hypothetical protein